MISNNSVKQLKWQAHLSCSLLTALCGSGLESRGYRLCSWASSCLPSRCLLTGLITALVVGALYSVLGGILYGSVEMSSLKPSNQSFIIISQHTIYLSVKQTSHGTDWLARELYINNVVMDLHLSNAWNFTEPALSRHPLFNRLKKTK